MRNLELFMVFAGMLCFNQVIAQCSATLPADECITAPTIVLNGTYCGSTCSYTAGSSALWFKNSNAYCTAVAKQTVENNSFVLFKPTSSSVTFEICALTGCSSNSNVIGASGIQALIFNFPTADGLGTCGSGSITGYYCLKQLSGTDCSPCGNPKGCLTPTISGLDVNKFYYFMVDGYEGDCCNFTVKFTSNISLPIVLLNFEGDATLFGNELKWQTASERNNERFEVERSYNGEHFEVIGTVKGAGNSTQEQTYSFIDTESDGDISYYRLRQVDYDENFSESYVIALSRKLAGDVAITPNPFSDELQLKIDAKYRGNYHISFVSLIGSKLTKTVLLEHGINTIKMNLANELAKGLYLVEVKDEAGTPLYTTKLIRN